MANEVAKKEGALVQFGGVVLTQEQMAVITHTIAPGLDNLELELFFYECKRRGVHPLDRMIYPIKRKDNSEDNQAQGGGKKLTFQCSIDYFRAASEDTGKYLGQKPVEFGPDVPMDKYPAGAGHKDMVPEYATVTLLRKNENGDVVEVPATAYWNEYYPGEKMGFMWRKMPRGQLAKCAEALAHRKAFPRELGGLYANEEVEKADDIPFAKVDTVRNTPRNTPGPAKTAGSSSSSSPQAEPEMPQEGEIFGPGTEARDTWPIPPEICDSNTKKGLYNEVMRRAAGNFDKAKEILKEASKFQGDRGGEIWIHLEKPADWKEGWCGKTLNKLRATKREPGAEG